MTFRESAGAILTNKLISKSRIVAEVRSVGIADLLRQGNAYMKQLLEELDLLHRSLDPALNATQ